jgi:hypothetical protein
MTDARRQGPPGITGGLDGRSHHRSDQRATAPMRSASTRKIIATSSPKSPVSSRSFSSMNLCVRMNRRLADQTASMHLVQERIAYHEAGHVAACHVFGLPIIAATIKINRTCIATAFAASEARRPKPSSLFVWLDRAPEQCCLVRPMTVAIRSISIWLGVTYAATSPIRSSCKWCGCLRPPNDW